VKGMRIIPHNKYKRKLILPYGQGYAFTIEYVVTVLLVILKKRPIWLHCV